MLKENEEKYERGMTEEDYDGKEIKKKGRRYVDAQKIL